MSSKTITVHVRGGKPLHGSVEIVPNKNAILPAIASPILTDDHMTYRNIPRSPDVIKMLSTLYEMGAGVDENTATISICCAGLKTSVVPPTHINDMQAGYLFAGPLLARFGEATIPISSGCRLGYRGYEDHAEYLRKVGVKFEVGEDNLHFSLLKPIKDDRISVVDEPYAKIRTITYSSPYVTPTENVLMLLSKTSRYTTEVSGIAQEPHVTQLIDLLYRMGAGIQGKGSTIAITGRDRLHGVEFVAEPDHVDYFGFAVMAAMTKSDLLLRVPTYPLPPGILHMNEFLEEMGVRFEVAKEGVLILGSASSYAPSETSPRAGKNMHKVNVSPWPGFAVDCLPSRIAFSCMSDDPLTGTRFLNGMYTDGLTYVPTLKEMGANVTYCDDQRAIVHGVIGGNPFNCKTTVTAPGVIEGVRALISCALAGGTHTIKGVEYILRRNPRFFTILQELGADIEVEEYTKEEALVN